MAMQIDRQSSGWSRNSGSAARANEAAAARLVPDAAQLTERLQGFLGQSQRAGLFEDGRLLFDFAVARYSLTVDHGRCVLQVWSEERNLIRRVIGVEERKGVLRLNTMRMGQVKPHWLELHSELDRRLPTERATGRRRFVLLLERVLQRNFTDWRTSDISTALDLERSFGPGYARAMMTRGQSAWAVIAVSRNETSATIAGVLTLGILWMEHCRARGGGRQLVEGLKVIVPAGMATLTAARMAWLNHKIAKWELYELEERSEELNEVDIAQAGNLETRLMHAPHTGAAMERFQGAIDAVRQLLPARAAPRMEMRVRSGGEIGFLLHGMEFARVRMRTAQNSFNRVEEMTFGAGANETPLTAETAGLFQQLTARLFARRDARGDKLDPLYRMQPERWMETEVRQHPELLDEQLEPGEVYAQVPAFAAADRGVLDLLAATRGGRLVVLELKADEDLHFALQGLDYWIRVRWHHLQQADAGGLGEFQRHGYFPGRQLAKAVPMLWLVAPALRIHPATEQVLKYFSPEVEWELIAIDERWREKIRVVFRKRSRTVINS